MSETVSTDVRNYSLCYMKNYFNKELASLFFTDNDLDINNNVKYDPDDEDDEGHTQYVFKTNVRKAKERLDTIGYSISRLEEKFNSEGYRFVDYDSYLTHLHKGHDDYKEEAKQRYKEKVTYTKWYNSFNKIIRYELENGNIYEFSKVQLKGFINTECDKLIYYFITNDDTSYSYGLKLKTNDIPFIYRLVLENCDDEDDVTLDFTELQYWDEDSIPNPLTLDGTIEKTVILVEGTTDINIIEFSINELYPHLKDLVYIMDFDTKDGNKRDGGTSYLSKNISTFYFSKLKNRFVAIFDNDAEGFKSQQFLLRKITSWPSNIKILRYPELNEFKKYPCLSPNGKEEICNINIRACSIELYLPDFLIKNGDEFCPVIWESRICTNKDKNEYLYQGVIANKENIIDNFYEYDKVLKKGKKHINKTEWDRMKKLVESILFCYK